MKWYNCAKCATQTFVAGGNWEQEDLNVEAWAEREGGDGKSQKVWRVKCLEDVTGYDGKPLHYLSVNAITLDDADLPDWHRKGWVYYYENKVRKGAEPLQQRQGEAFPGGLY